MAGQKSEFFPWTQAKATNLILSSSASLRLRGGPASWAGWKEPMSLLPDAKKPGTSLSNGASGVKDQRT